MSTPFEREDVEQAAMEAQLDAAPEPSPAPAPPQRTGTIRLTFAEMEAVRGLRLAQEDLKRRDREFGAEIVQKLPPGARLTGMDIEAGTATWQTPEGTAP